MRPPYLPFVPDAAHLFFQLVSRRYERGAMLVTSNRAVGEWGQVLGDAVVANAILDRLLLRSRQVDAQQVAEPWMGVERIDEGPDNVTSERKRVVHLAPDPCRGCARLARNEHQDFRGLDLGHHRSGQPGVGAELALVEPDLDAVAGEIPEQAPHDRFVLVRMAEEETRHQRPWNQLITLPMLMPSFAA